MSVSFWIDGHSNWETDPNFSNVNAQQIIDVLGLPAYPYELSGTIHPSGLDRIIKNATRALNANGDYGTPAPEEDEDGKARVIHCGTTDESVRGRIQAVLKLCVKARELNLPVNFG
ncbi:MAG: hypothetical protein JW704_13220 [Anaerolineaceae bacterium]|nr:hypothetical protein [Anaerolineaceae bacterium]